jgi:hypothetical protein
MLDSTKYTSPDLVNGTVTVDLQTVEQTTNVFKGETITPKQIMELYNKYLQLL